jgi:hypothetical protein
MIRKFSLKEQQSLSVASAAAHETLTCIRTVNAFNGQAIALER